MESKSLNELQIITLVGQMLLAQRFDDLGQLARSDLRVLKQLAGTIKDGQPPFFFLAATALSKAGPSATPYLLEALTHPQHPVRQMAAMALGDIRESSAIAALVEALNDPQEVVRQAAAFSLGKLHAREAVEALLQHLSDDSELVRNAAVKALGLIGDARALPALRHAASTDTEKVSGWAKDAIMRIQGTRQ
ncbi:MAG: HEAT repeat domain-containing protein [Anaerolineae bacterium]|nr:HEAT repeat domain-containing protein [Anaerolineae bacterium]